MGSTLTLTSLFSSVATVVSMRLIQGLSLDSRTVKQGYVYFAVQGSELHGLDYIDDVIKEGAIAVVVDSSDSEVTDLIVQDCAEHDVILIRVEDIKEKMGDLAARYYGNDLNPLLVIGITGTDGKTSVSQFIAKALVLNGELAAVMGTNGWGLVDDLNESQLTTPDVIEVHRQLAALREMGVKYVCMEVSSHALDQGRVNGVEFSVAVLTNLARDHLDYHGTIENYAIAKTKLFRMEGLSAIIINADDSLGAKLIDSERKTKVVSYGLKNNSSVMASKINRSRDGLVFTVTADEKIMRVNSQLLGDFNVYNLLAVFAVLREVGVSLEKAIFALQSITSVTGRMEKLSLNEASPLVVVDFAHTPQALEQALLSIKQCCNGQIICVFGCGGDRDKGKRVLMGEISSRLADRTIITNDNPRTENPKSIACDIRKGFNENSAVEIVLDREQAVLQAIASSQGEDCLLIAGKGHENYQIIGHERYEFNDRVVVEEGLQRWAL